MVSKRSLNKHEQEIADRNPNLAMVAVHMAIKATFEESARYQDAGVDNGNANAFLHTYWSALLAENTNERCAFEWTNAHEKEVDAKLSTQMDLHNNRLGIELVRFNPSYSNEKLAILVEREIDRGMGRRVQDGALVGTDGQTKKEKNIFTAIYNRVLSIILELIDLGFAFKRNADGRTPLIAACSENYYDAVEALVVSSDVNAVDSQGSTPLIASIKSEQRIMKLLLDSGANINLQNPIDGENALMKASAYGLVEVVEYLLARNADTKLKNLHGLTALDIAKIENHQKVVQVLAANEE